MIRFTIVAVLLILFVSSAWAQTAGKQWILLVAGSNGYYNYRHQSDVYHSYQIFKKNGIPDSQIICMHYDDIASSPSNPKRGEVYNIIGGPNVYVNIPKDYVGQDVTAKNFLKILSGQDMTGVGSGKTIKSGPNDRIFVAFFDHGATGLIAFPVGGYLYAKDMIATLQSMHEGKKYKELLFYMEACESGSMFNGLLPPTWNIYATTAANPFQSSYACDMWAPVNAYLNDCYSRNWMNSTDHHNVFAYTILDQFKEVKQLTKESHVCQYGDAKISSEFLSNFMAVKTASPDGEKRSIGGVSSQPISSRDVYENYLKQQVESAQSNVLRLTASAQLQQYYKDAARSDVIYGAFAHALKLNVEPSNDEDHCNSRSVVDMDCTKAGYEAHNEACGLFTEYSFRYAKYVHFACAQGHSAESIAKQFQKVCSVVAH